MTDQQSWTEQWLKAQQQFVDSWSEMAKKSGDAAKMNQADLWAESFAIWNHGLQQTQATDFGGLLNKTMEIGKSIFSMAEQIGKHMETGQDPMAAIQLWIDTTITMLQNSPLQAASMNPDSFGGLMNHWMAPAAFWQQMSDSLGKAAPWQMPSMSGPAFNMGEAVDPLGKILQTPGIGFFREPQEKQQLGIRLFMDYQQANLVFNQAFIRVAVEALNDLRQHLVNLKPAEFPASLRALYDLWVDISEKHYAEFAMSDEYPAIYGDMVNKLMALKKHYQDRANEVFEAMNLPTSGEVDTMQRRLQETRRENGRLRHEVAELRKTVEMLSQQVQAISGKPASRQTGAASAKPKSAATRQADAGKATPKKTVRKKTATRKPGDRKAVSAKKSTHS